MNENDGATRVVYIAGLARSGTTFLELVLSGHKDIVGLGEISQTIDGICQIPQDIKKYGIWIDIQKRSCSCGESVDGCEFWGDFKGKDWSKTELFEVIFQRAKEVFPNKVIVDSSKHITSYEKYYLRSNSVKPRVVLLIRDFRSWIPSISKHAQKLNLRAPSYVYQGYRWYWANRRYIKFFSDAGVDFLVVSYERLVFDFEAEISRIAEFVGVDTEKFGGEATAHDVYGSLHKNIGSKIKMPKYDYSWMADSNLSALNPLLLPQLILNKKIYDIS